MIKKIKDRINIYVDGKLKTLFKRQRAISQIQFNYAQLNQLFTDTSFFIPMSKWAMSPSTIAHVLNDIIVNDRKSIIEFGSGASTLYIAKLLKSNKIEASFFSVESNSDWADKIKKQLELLDLSSYVTIINAPIKSIDTSFALGEQKVWYAIETLNDSLKTAPYFDLVLVDGPFGGLTFNSRFSAIPYLKDKLAKTYAVFLDDIDRDDEKDILKNWEDILQCSKQTTERYAVLSSNTEFFSKPFQL
ncbi:MAG: hypothetical protein ABI371_02710 [Gelidibacter sp.]